MQKNSQLIVSNVNTLSVSLESSAETIRKNLLEQSQAIVSVQSPSELELAVAVMRENKRMLQEVETTRKAVKLPAQQFGKRTDEIAESFCQPINDEQSRINNLVTQFQRDEAERVRLENERLENERLQREKEAADALAEQERVANLKKPSAKAEIAAETKVVETQVALKQSQTVAAPAVARASGLVIKKEVKHEVTDAAALYAVRPEWFNLVPKTAIIKASITKDSKFPGLRVWEETNTNVRG